MLFDLVFEGGGVRGIAFLGALEALADNGHTFDRLMGTSVGGLTAALLVTGHDVRSMRDLIFNPQSGRLAIADVLEPYPALSREEIGESATRQLLRDVDLPFVPNVIEGGLDELLARALMSQQRLRDLFSVVEFMGARQDTQWLAWLGEQLNKHAGGQEWASMGLADLYRRTGRALTVIASDISASAMLVLNHSTAPDLPLQWAVRMTTSVPLLFTPVIWRPEWGLYRGRRLEGHYIVDGALLSQFPLEYFLSPQEEIQVMMGERKAGNNVLGFLLDEEKPLPGIKARAPILETSLDEVPGVRVSRLLLNTLVQSSRRSTINPLESHVVRLPVMGIDPYAFTATREQLLPAINAAYNVMQDFLHGWEADPRRLLTPFEQQYARVVAEKFVVSGDYYNIGSIVESSVAIGQEASVDIDTHGGEAP